MVTKSASKIAALRALPSVDEVLRTETAGELESKLGSKRLATLAREVMAVMRRELQTNGKDDEISRALLLKEAERRLFSTYRDESMRRLQKVINATGVILHTNLGRAPLSAAARRAVSDEAAGYCTLEFDLSTGERGSRGGLVEELLVQLTGAEAALVVNNCAAAALLTLSILARDGETIVSRGELVEIGGDFRVPDVMASSGTSLIEVGTTNRTSISDYAKAINARTRLIMRVHTSNYRIVGFTSTPTLVELAEVAHKAGLPFYEDAGSGALIDFSEYGISGEPLISESIAAGVDVISFSGDKLLGGPQAGLIAGRSEIIRRLKSHALYRALRADKLALAALEVTLDAHRRGQSVKEVPAQRMISMSAAEIKARTRAFIERVRGFNSLEALRLELLAGNSAIGGGSAPTSHPVTTLISVTHKTLTAAQIESRLRQSSPSVIARIAEDRVLLDLRTVAEDEESHLTELLASLEGAI